MTPRPAAGVTWESVLALEEHEDSVMFLVPSAAVAAMTGLAFGIYLRATPQRVCQAGVPAERLKHGQRRLAGRRDLARGSYPHHGTAALSHCDGPDRRVVPSRRFRTPGRGGGRPGKTRTAAMLIPFLL